MAGLDEGSALFIQIAERLADQIAEGTLAEGERAPSTNELSAYYRINPATAAKGLNVMIDDGLLVSSGARQQLLDSRRKQFADRFVDPLIAEATRLGINTNELVALIENSNHTPGGTNS
jgi:DNA-binding transcriptional regulator YhcF (GntR family)